jgi:hypothetical protein
MSSGDIKEMIASQFYGQGAAAIANNWKRTSKKSVQTRYGTFYQRTFQNPKTGDEVITLADEDADEVVVLDAGTMFYHVEIQDMSMMGGDKEGVFVMFCPEAKWKRDHCIPDQHLEMILTTCYGLAEGFLEEMAENQFIARAGLTIEDVKSHLNFIGMVEHDMSLAGTLGEEQEDTTEAHNGLTVVARKVRRSDAIGALNDLFDPSYMDEEDRQDYAAMSNEELLEQICSSGLVHDEDVDAVID